MNFRQLFRRHKRKVDHDPACTPQGDDQFVVFEIKVQHAWRKIEPKGVARNPGPGMIIQVIKGTRPPWMMISLRISP